MNWQVNDYVVHTRKPDWGVGKVYKSDGAFVSVFFVGAGSKDFSVPSTFLDAAPAGLHGHPLLDNIAPQALSSTAKVLPLAACIRYFEQLFPGGFYSAEYLNNERDYKTRAAEFAQGVLSEAAWRDLLEQGDVAEICNRLGKIEAKTNLLHSFEKIKWHAALKEPSLQEPIARALFDEVFAGPGRMPQFDALRKVLALAEGCSKWTIASFYGAVYQPATRVFIKPEVTKYAAEACAWDIQYESALNWNTLSRIEGLAQYLFNELERCGLKPRDMIDIQSFIWCINPDTYGAIAALQNKR